MFCRQRTFRNLCVCGTYKNRDGSNFRSEHNSLSAPINLGSHKFTMEEADVVFEAIKRSIREVVRLIQSNIENKDKDVCR